MRLARLKFAALCLLAASALAPAQQRYTATGLVLSVDRAARSIVVSCDEIRGYMPPMTMTFMVPDAKALDSLSRGAFIDFTLVEGKDSPRAEDVRVRVYDSAEREPSKARRLQAFDEAIRNVHRLSPGQSVPDFTLTDQLEREIRFRQFAGKVVAINFVYTRCVLPEYCYRSSNNFGVLQRQFEKRLGKDVVLLTVTFDPVHDGPEALRNYAKTWKANPEYWHFLTGDAASVQRVCDLFGVAFAPDEGLFVHSVHTAIVARNGKLVANLEGNQFSAQQVADLIKDVLDRGE